MTDVILAVLGRRETAQAVLDAATVPRRPCRSCRHHRARRFDATPRTGPLAAEALMAEAGDVEDGRTRERRRIASLRPPSTPGRTAPGTPANGAMGRGAGEAASRRRGARAACRHDRDRPAPDRTTMRRRAHAFRAALFHTERPVLVVPESRAATFGRRVAIAWRDDARTAKAIIPALRLLGSAEQVFLLAGVRKGAATRWSSGRPARPWDRGRSAHPADRRGCVRKAAVADAARTRRRHAGDGRLRPHAAARADLRRGHALYVPARRRTGAHAASTADTSRVSGVRACSGITANTPTAPPPVRPPPTSSVCPACRSS